MPARRSPFTTLPALALAALLALPLAACGDGEDDGDAAAEDTTMEEEAGDTTMESDAGGMATGEDAGDVTMEDADDGEERE
jgi:hypothetical protein